VPRSAKPSPILQPVLPQPPWRLEEAKARFSEVVRRARTEGPQHVTVRGQPAVVVISADELRRLLPAAQPLLPLVEFLQGLDFSGVNLEREPDQGRDVVL